MRKASKGYEDWIIFYPQQEFGRFDYWSVAELHATGEVTIWDYAMFGAIGQTGKPKPGTIIKPVTTAKERAEVDRVKKMIARGIERSQAQYELLKALEV